MTISLHPDGPSGHVLAGSPAADGAAAAKASGGSVRSRLFTKYVVLFVAVVAIALLANGIFEVIFYYREHKAALIRIQHEQAEVTKMIKVYGAPIDDADVGKIVDYLAATY